MKHLQSLRKSSIEIKEAINEIQIFRVPQSFEGDEWLYQYTDDPYLHAHLYSSLETGGVSYKVPANYPLYPGEHRFMVELITPTERVYAKSKWIDFTVP